ncbi:ATP-binding protein [Kitasatospora sp. NPDC058190]|uniref:ATP-binding protein n=1 Tax=Kitasatospora sp. NPDC058190 TaxID=3346371 RepID=UPI0036DCF75C
MHRSADDQILAEPEDFVTAAVPLPARISGPATATLKYQPESAGAARRLVRRKLQDWGLNDLVDDAQLIVTELVSNACKTGCMTFMTVKIRRITSQTVRISVRDGSRTMPVLLHAACDEECHRGLALVQKLTSGRWGAALDAHGKTVHADLCVR